MVNPHRNDSSPHLPRVFHRENARNFGRGGAERSQSAISPGIKRLHRAIGDAFKSTSKRRLWSLTTSMAKRNSQTAGLLPQSSGGALQRFRNVFHGSLAFRMLR